MMKKQFGGIVAILENANIENCRNSGEILGTNNIGGIAGENKGNILNCNNDANVSKFEETICKSVNIGGIVGINYDSSKISNSKNSRKYDI